MRITSPSTLLGTLGALAQAAIGAVNAIVVTIRGYTYGASFVSTTVLASNVSQQVIAPASNTAGVIVWRAAGKHMQSSGNADIALQAHTSAPNSLTVGDPLATTDNASASAAPAFYSSFKLEAPVFIIAGKGLYFTANAGEAGSPFRSVLYTIL